ncbi:TIGR04211 family SH3 domain-containing protein [Halopseudomonas yangmingensis]|uniref:SH3 domain protein n=1 Tax=Halopseudomonas yangmingensis TaxID=1720063 RepID=A0A1I4P9X9_9GAMM|nr:SH3 domain protein [Halopseudomonas yangmingensis]
MTKKSSVRLTSPLLSPMLLATLLLALPSAASSQTTQRWVSDSLNTWVRSGPSDGHRIVGTLQSGQAVTLIGSEGKYSQVRNESGNSVWILSSELQSVPGQAERIPALEQQVNELSSELENINQSWELRVQGMQETLETRKALIEELEQQRAGLNAELLATQSELREAHAKLGDENQQLLLRYMLYGGGIAGAGLLAGLILPLFVRRRKRRSDVWV